MLDKKRRFFRLLEIYMNDIKKDEVELMYGKGSKIKIHNWSHNLTGDKVIFDMVIVLGELIDESVMDTSFSEILLKDALVYFYPEIFNIGCIVSFDV